MVTKYRLVLFTIDGRKAVGVVRHHMHLQPLETSVHERKAAYEGGVAEGAGLDAAASEGPSYFAFLSPPLRNWAHTQAFDAAGAYYPRVGRSRVHVGE